MGIPCAGLHSHYCPLSALLPLLLLLTLVFPCTNGSGVEGVQPVHSTSSSGGGNATKRSFFPEGFRPMPERDVPYPHLDHGDPEELIYLSEYSKENMQHLPMPFNIGFQAFVGLQLSDFSSNGIIVGHHEQEALRAHLVKIGRLRSPSTLFTPPSEVLLHLIQGDDVHTTVDMLAFTNRYFVELIGPATFRQRFCTKFLELMHLPKMPPLVVDMYNWHLGEFTLWCLYYQSHALQTAKRKFVLVGSEGDQPTTFSFFFHEMEEVQSFVNLTYLLSHPLLAQMYSVNGNIRHPKFTSLPLGFLYFHRTNQGIMGRTGNDLKFDATVHSANMKLYLKGLDLHKVFPHIQHELRFGRVGAVWLETALEMFAGGTTDPPVEWIPLEQLPERVTTIYVVLMPLEREKREGRPSLTSEVLVFRSESGNRATAAAQHVALLPFTAALYHKLQQHPYGDPSRELKVIKAYTERENREDLTWYLKNHPDIVVTAPSTAPFDFYRLLLDFAFVASPMGQGYECYRTWESMAFGSIPILLHPESMASKAVGLVEERLYQGEISVKALTEVYEELPVVVVNDPAEITLENLEKWRAEIYEKAKRGEYQLEKLFSQHWIDKIYGHLNEVE